MCVCVCVAVRVVREQPSGSSRRGLAERENLRELWVPTKNVSSRATHTAAGASLFFSLLVPRARHTPATYVTRAKHTLRLLLAGIPRGGRCLAASDQSASALTPVAPGIKGAWHTVTKHSLLASQCSNTLSSLPHSPHSIQNGRSTIQQQKEPSGFQVASHHQEGKHNIPTSSDWLSHQSALSMPIS